MRASEAHHDVLADRGKSILFPAYVEDRTIGHRCGAAALELQWA
jgi:hypothetical protein